MFGYTSPLRLVRSYDVRMVFALELHKPLEHVEGHSHLVADCRRRVLPSSPWQPNRLTIGNERRSTAGGCRGCHTGVVHHLPNTRVESASAVLHLVIGPEL